MHLASANSICSCSTAQTRCSATGEFISSAIIRRIILLMPPRRRREGLNWVNTMKCACKQTSNKMALLFVLAQTKEWQINRESKRSSPTKTRVNDVLVILFLEWVCFFNIRRHLHWCAKLFLPIKQLDFSYQNRLNSIWRKNITTRRSIFHSRIAIRYGILTIHLGLNALPQLRYQSRQQEASQI